MKCQFCGYESDESSRFCVKCGKSLSEAISDTAETTKSESDNSKTAEPAVSDAVTAEPEAITPESVDNPAAIFFFSSRHPVSFLLSVHRKQSPEETTPIPLTKLPEGISSFSISQLAH